MLAQKIKAGYILGYSEVDTEKDRLVGSNLFPENLKSSTTIKSIKIWFGAPKNEPDQKSLLGMKVTYINYITGEKKETNYQGAPIEGTDVDIKELVVKEGDYLSKFNIGFTNFINHIKFTTLKGEKIELGEIKEETEKKVVNKINKGNNVIVNIKGYSSQSGIRAIGCDYISLSDFCFARWFFLLRLRNKLKDDKYKSEYQEKYDKLNETEKCFFRICNSSKVIFSSILKYV